MASLEGISLEFTAGDGHLSRTLLSSVGGFSQPSRRQIRSLQQLLGTIRPLGLEFFPEHSLREEKFLGEGVSYTVFKCSQRESGKVVAVKQIKLPSASTSEAFERQVACVLRDIEVMSHGPLAGHDNVLDILGYGWNFRGSGSIPFLVTEYATSGTMRDYLRRYRLPSRDKLLLCVNVARGIHELHLCGMAHGDLKLDNVLVSSATSAEANPNVTVSQIVVAKIADFGHSLLLYEDGDAREDQRYGGTLAYNAPEIAARSDIDRGRLNFRKCDVWALGLLCWEALDNGSSYYKSSRIQELIMFSKTDSRSSSDNSVSASKNTTGSVLESLSSFSGRLKELALEFLESEVVQDLFTFERAKLKELFLATLAEDPDSRVADIPMLPLLLKTKTKTDRSKLGQKSAEWSFEVFRPRQLIQIPYRVKVQIFEDCCRIGSEPGNSGASSRAAFQVGLALLAGFGSKVNTHEAVEWITKSSNKGLPIAKTFCDFIKDTCINRDSQSIGEINNDRSDGKDTCLNYTNVIREAFQNLDVPYLDVIPSRSKLTYAELRAVAEDHMHHQQEGETPTPFYVCHYAVLHGLTSFLVAEDDPVDLQAQPNGDTALLLACQLGDINAVNDLIGCGADPQLAAYDGCLPIHWLWMFSSGDMEVAADLLLLSPEIRSRDLGERHRFPSARYMRKAKARLAFAKGKMGPHVNGPTSRIRYLDPQAPLQLIGTPLAFAVAVGSMEAVMLLLHLGADPVAGPNRWEGDWRNRSPLHLATSLHLREISKLLLERWGEDRVSNALIRGTHPSYDDILNPETPAWHAIAETSIIERTFHHGTHTVQAAAEMIELLRKHLLPGYDKPVISTIGLAIAATEVADLSIANVGVELPIRLMNGSLESSLSVDDRNQLMLLCTKVACRDGIDPRQSKEFLDFALSRGSPVNCSVERRAINIAIEHHREEVLDWFLQEAGTDVNAQDRDGGTPLHNMIRSGFSSRKLLQKLVTAGASLNVSADHVTRMYEPGATVPGDTPLHIAVRNDKMEETAFLLEHGADPVLKKDDFFQPSSPFHLAVRRGRLGLVALILQHSLPLTDSSVNVLDQVDLWGNTPLTLAADYGDESILSLLLKSGADQTKCNKDGFNCLHLAAKALHHKVLPLLAEKVGVNSLTGHEKETALHLVTKSLRSTNEASLLSTLALLQAGADPTIEDLHGKTPLEYIAQISDGEDEERRLFRKPILEMLVERGVDLDHSSGSEASMIHQAIMNFDRYFVEDLLKLGPKVWRANHRGWTPLHRCASMGLGTSVNRPGYKPRVICDITEMLIEAGAEVEALDNEGRTPLELSIILSNAPVTFLLLGHYVSERPLPSSALNDASSLTSSMIPQVPEKVERRRVLGSVVGKVFRGYNNKTVTETNQRDLDDLRFANRGVGAEDRQILERVWQMAIRGSHWDSVCAFIQQGLHGSTTLLKWPVGSALFKYALEGDIGSVLIMFMGLSNFASVPEEEREPDIVLNDIWKRIQRWTSTQQRKVVGASNAGRLNQLLEADGYTDYLDLSALMEMGYVEGQHESMIEVVVTKGEIMKVPRIYEQVFADPSKDEADADYDVEVQERLQSLSWKTGGR